MLTWTSSLKGSNPEVLGSLRDEVDSQIGGLLPDVSKIVRLEYMEQVINESLRLYPPIHVGNWIAAIDLDFQEYRIPAETHVMYSIYLFHRQEKY